MKFKLDHFDIPSSGIEAKNSEVLKDTQATISCVVTGLTKQLDTVAWQKPGGTPINDGDNGYGIAVGTWDSGSKSQTTILTIPAAENTADKVYTCVITSNEYGVTERKTDVNSNVYSKCKLRNSHILIVITLTYLHFYLSSKSLLLLFPTPKCFCTFK